jgi:glucose-1-phosphate thymidylyltransferase
MVTIVLAATHEKGVNSKGELVPRPLLEIDNKEPLLSVLVKKLAGICSNQNMKIYVVTNEAIRKKMETWAEDFPDVRVISDDTQTVQDQKGAVGDLIYAIKHENINADILVIGGYNWFTFDLSAFVEHAKLHSPSVIVTSISPVLKSSRFGMVQMDENDRIVKFSEKPDKSTSELKASCVYYFSASDLKWLDEYAKNHSTLCSPGTFFEWLVDHTVVYGMKMTATWYDIGDPIIKNIKGPDYIKIRDIIRSYANPLYSTWEREVAQKLQWVSSHEELLEVLKDKDIKNINARIVATRILGHIGNMVNDEGKSIIINELISLLNDDSMNAYTYAVYQEDEESAFYIAATAAESLALLGYARNNKEVFDKADKAGIPVKICYNIVK